jgi:rRNA maturation RNase YbeY
MIPVDIVRNQRAFRIDARALRKLARTLAAKSGRSLRDITLILVDDAGIAPINAAAVGHSGATDVITMVYPALPGEPPGDSAEIVLNVECAWKQGGGEGGADRELAYYLAHAFDHLAGHDDATPAARTAMHRRERRWLGELAPLPRLFTFFA